MAKTILKDYYRLIVDGIIDFIISNLLNLKVIQDQDLNEINEAINRFDPLASNFRIVSANDELLQTSIQCWYHDFKNDSLSQK